MSKRSVYAVAAFRAIFDQLSARRLVAPTFEHHIIVLVLRGLGPATYIIIWRGRHLVHFAARGQSMPHAASRGIMAQQCKGHHAMHSAWHAYARTSSGYVQEGRKE